MTADDVRSLIREEIRYMLTNAYSYLIPIPEQPRRPKGKPNRHHADCPKPKRRKGIFAAENAWRRSQGRAALPKLK